MAENPVLVENLRGGVIESFHRGVVCMVDNEGKIVFSLGNSQQLCFPRSCLKLFQAIPLVESGAIEAFEFTEQEIAIMCGSHNAEPAQLKLLETMLQKISLEKSALQCGPQYPTLPEARNKLIAEGCPPEAIYNNCSGKHIGFLAMCIYMGWRTDNYLSPEHPLQQLIKRVVSEMFEYPLENIITATDGCSAPIFALPVYNQAVGYKNLVHPVKFSDQRQAACEKIVNAIAHYPYMVGGTDRYCTEMMEICGEKIIGKTGADGVMCLGFRESHRGCAIKIDDGLMGPQYRVAEEIITRLHIFPEEKLQPLAKYLESPILNCAKKETGETIVKDSAFYGLNH